MPFAGVAGPARGVHPFGAVAGGVEVEGDEDDVGMPGRAGDDGAKVMKCCRERNNRE